MEVCAIAHLQVSLPFNFKLLQKSMTRLRILSCHTPPQPESARHAEPVRVFALTDIHTDYKENLAWIESLAERGYREQDVLILSGDVSDSLGTLRQTLSSLRRTFGRVFFVPGNHDLWIRDGEAEDSVQKLHLVLALCEELGISVKPERIGGLWIVPLLSWHHSSWDSESDIPDMGSTRPQSFASYADYRACRWPDSIEGASENGSLELARWFDNLNDGLWNEGLRCGCDVISFAHFLPFQELLPEKRFLYLPLLAQVSGSVPLAARVGNLQPDIHLFGHTHFSWDSTLQSIRYLQVPLCYPSERHRRLPSISISKSALTSDPTASPAASDAGAEAFLRELPLLIYEAFSSCEALGQGDRFQCNPSINTLSDPSDVQEAAEYKNDDNKDASMLSASQTRRKNPDIHKRSRNGGWVSQTAVDSIQNPADAQHIVDGTKLRHGWMCRPIQSLWSEYYESTPRDPMNTEPASWVVKRRARRQGLL